MSAIATGPAFESLWHVAIERQRIFWQRVIGAPPPWTKDEIIRRNRFCNAYRASDRTSQDLIRVIYDYPDAVDERFFRVLLYNSFKKIETFAELKQGFEEAGLVLSWAQWDPVVARNILNDLRDNGHKVFTAAYIITGARCHKHGICVDSHSKVENVLRVVEGMMQQRAWEDVYSAEDTKSAFERLCQWPLMGRFSGMQMVTDLGYTPEARWNEDQWVQPGPGAMRGLRRVFPEAHRYEPIDLITYLRNLQGEHLTKDKGWMPLPGRALSLMDIQNLLCETDKYSRQAHPSDPRVTRRKRIKQGYNETDTRGDQLPMPWYPPHWNINGKVFDTAMSLMPMAEVKRLTGEFVAELDFDV